MQKKGSTYSDIHTFANAVYKIEKFLKRAVSQKKRYYEPTRMLYLKLAQKLESCAKLAYQLAGKQVEEQPHIVAPPKVKSSVPVKEVISEPVFDLVLSSMDKPAVTAENGRLSKDDAKKIVRTYLKCNKKLSSKSEFARNQHAIQCASLLSSWLQLRFGKKSTIFHYNPENIKVWIDRFIYAYSYHWKFHLLAKFETDLNDWIVTLKKLDCKYPLPAFIFNMEDEDDPDMYCVEAMFLERVIKIVIYNDEFYPKQLHSIETRVLQEHPEFGGLETGQLELLCTEDERG